MEADAAGGRQHGQGDGLVQGYSSPSATCTMGRAPATALPVPLQIRMREVDKAWTVVRALTVVMLIVASVPGSRFDCPRLRQFNYLLGSCGHTTTL